MTPATVRFYSKPGCHLCEAAEVLLEEVAAARPISLQTIDITTDMDLFSRYRYEIPVIEVEGGGTVSGRVTLADLQRALGVAPHIAGGETPATGSLRHDDDDRRR